MAEWKHQIPITELYSDIEDYDQQAIAIAGKTVCARLIEHRAFLRYVGLDKDDLDAYTEIADEFDCGEIIVLMGSGDFDEALNNLYDWADKHRVWID